MRHLCLKTTIVRNLQPGAWLGLLAGLAMALICPYKLLALTEAPPADLKEQLMVKEKSVSTFIPSAAAPGAGMAVNIIYPQKPRYKDGAPVVVVAPDGAAGDGLKFSAHAAQSGFAEVRFAFPGGGTTGFTSGGLYDNRGPKCQEALKDVLQFAAGKLADREGRKIAELVPVKIYNGNIGLLGWSNGGNIAAVTVGRYAEQMPFLGWMCFYETPMGPLCYPPNLGGGQDLLINSHYRQGSAATGHCLIDFRKLSYQKDGQKHPGAHKKLGEPEIAGVVYFDENHNHKWDEPIEFAFDYCVSPGVHQQIYPPPVTNALSRLTGFDEQDWPPSIAKLPESQLYFEQHDGSQWIHDIAKQLPNCLILVVATQMDHLGRQADHPHIALQYNCWLSERQHWVRLNPDPVYVGATAQMNRHQFPDNEPNASLDADAIDDFLEPEGLVPDYVFVEAALCELSDRLKAKKINAKLTVPLVIYSNGAVDPNAPPDKPAAAKTRTETTSPGQPTTKATGRKSPVSH